MSNFLNVYRSYEMKVIVSVRTVRFLIAYHNRIILFVSDLTRFLFKMEGGPAQDSGVETEFDMESNDSSMSR